MVKYVVIRHTVIALLRDILDKLWQGHHHYRNLYHYYFTEIASRILKYESKTDRTTMSSFDKKMATPVHWELNNTTNVIPCFCHVLTLCSAFAHCIPVTDYIFTVWWMLCTARICSRKSAFQPRGDATVLEVGGQLSPYSAYLETWNRTLQFSLLQLRRLN